ncbi:LysR family transcriptional regulator [Klebsiella aerogenes]|uniref:helix-turn-helix domain-containing protein n=1 Tax=Klebsiella aerogenes TaxID=548 RepID=UPI0007500DBD|nr:LysR family transcriptional regulator [Klebsiella aerogenes]ELS5748331.1 LysR family transcriptional regulator [Klebsiella aerogenes]KUQ07730.1 hypothetical protein AWI08_04515 [Klebsiella aerogenes]HEO1675207.1 LysR family transcriptional regulator [Klebsiella aerogenes]
MTIFISKKFHYFIVLAKELSFTTAACKLYITLSPLCKIIKQLENDIGTLLFTRTKNGLTLTDNGIELYNFLYPIYIKLNAINIQFNSKKPLRIGVYGGVDIYHHRVLNWINTLSLNQQLEIEQFYEYSNEEFSNYNIVISIKPFLHPGTVLLHKRVEPIYLYTSSLSKDNKELPFIQSKCQMLSKKWRNTHQKFVSMGYSENILRVDNYKLRLNLIRKAHGVMLASEIEGGDLLNIEKTLCATSHFTVYMYINKKGGVDMKNIQPFFTTENHQISKELL